MVRRAAILALALAACGKALAGSDDPPVEPVPDDGGADVSSEIAPPPDNEETTVPVEPKTPQDSGLGDGPTVEGGVGGGAKDCTSTRGPTMVELDFGAESFCIDSTEVTNAQYKPFLDQIAAKTYTPVKHGRCGYNTNYAPNCGGKQTTADNDPITCIDWCDAWSYCKWAGKRLCGKIGPGDNANASGDYKDATKSQWFAACSLGGTQDYSYGKTPMNVCQSSTQTPAAVKSHPQCIGAYPGLFDLNGNVGEWEDSCVNGATELDDQCRRRGGDIEDTYQYQQCSQDHSISRGARQTSGGFRCCRY